MLWLCCGVLCRIVYAACPADPFEQMRLAIVAVFSSWNSSRANKYRAINQITGLKGTAVNIQAMVFGNMGETSGTGVLFTRNPSTGEAKLYGEYLINAQVGPPHPHARLHPRTSCTCSTLTFSHLVYVHGGCACVGP